MRVLIRSVVLSGVFGLSFATGAVANEIPAVELAALQTLAAEGMSEAHQQQMQQLSAQMESLSAQMDELNAQMVLATAKNDHAAMMALQQRTLRLSQASQAILLQMNNDTDQLAQSY